LAALLTLSKQDWFKIHAGEYNFTKNDFYPHLKKPFPPYMLGEINNCKVTKIYEAKEKTCQLEVYEQSLPPYPTPNKKYMEGVRC